MLVARPGRDAAVTLAALLLAACGGADRSLAPDRPSLARAPAAAAATVDVRPGESIQAAVDAAAPGTTIRVRPGLYRQSVLVRTANITIAGVIGPRGERAVIENPGSVQDGVRAEDAADGFVLTDVTVRGFTRFGVVLIAADNFRLARIIAENNGAYGLYPIRSSNGVIEYCAAFGSYDAGYYVGLSNNVKVRYNLAYRNVAGIEVSNTVGVEVYGNVVTDNSIGILATIVPGRPVLTSTDMIIRDNVVAANNRANFAPPDQLVALVPPGIGILVIGPDRVTVESNEVVGNAFFGIGVVDEATLAALGLPPEDLAGIETASNQVRVRQNILIRNGFAPPPELAGVFPGVDLLWDGSGTGNCWSRNIFRTSAPSPLPACP